MHKGMTLTFRGVSATDLVARKIVTRVEQMGLAHSAAALMLSLHSIQAALHHCWLEIFSRHVYSKDLPVRSKHH